jgi:Protein of unknown function (DUF1552)
MQQHVRLIRATRLLERRMFLKALALGLTVPAAARLARTASAATSAAPKRFFLMYMPHGIAPEHYNPKIVGGDNTNFVLNDTNVSILGPLEQYKSYVNVYQGFKYPGGGTHTGIVSCLSGADQPVGNAQATPETTTPRTTVEHAIAHGLGVTPLILGACSHQPYGLDSNGMLFWDSTPVEPQKNPAAAADKLFANLSTPTAPTVNPDVQLRQDLLTLTGQEIQALSATLGNLTTEKTKLAQHLQSIQALQSGSGGNAPILGCTTRPTLPTVEMVRAASAGQVIDSSGGNDYFYHETNFKLIFQAQLELIAQALICNAAQVVALMPMYATCDFDFSFSQLPGAAAPAGGWAHHAGLSHTTFQQASGAQYNSPLSVNNFNPTTRAAFAGAQLWFTQQLVQYVVSALATTDDPSAPGTKVLDNTLIYWMSEIGDGQGHTTGSAIEYPQVPSFLPLVTIGKAGGALKTGQIVPFATDRPATDLYLSLSKAMGVGTATFPATTGPVTEVLT